MNLQRIKDKVLDQYGPTEEELESADDLYTEISRFIEEEFQLETHFAGSAARKTCMAGDKDVDIFVMFSADIPEKELENKGLNVGKSVFKQFNAEPHVEYAEHPYTKGKIKDHEVEIVPCYDVEASEIKSSVDRTPHHTKWVRENLDESQRKDVVVLKRFLNAADIYGSSLKTRGFSGYLCEILISYYGGFEELMEKASEWQKETVIDPEEQLENGLPPELEEKFIDEPLKVIDPVDPDRNVASVLSLENYTKFTYRCMRFVENPGINYFDTPEREVTEFEIDQELERRNHFIVIDFEPPKEVEDIVYPQMRKALRALERELEDNEFRIFEKGLFVGSKARFYFEVEPKLPATQYVKGPKIFHGRKHVEEFRSKYQNVFIREDRLVAKTERDFTDIKEFLKDRIDNAERIGIPSRIAEKMETFSFVEPLDGDAEWLKHLAEELHLEGEQRFLT